MSSDLAQKEMNAEKLLQESTDKAWSNPKQMADIILQGVNNQSTESWADQVEENLASHTQTEVPDTTQGLPDDLMSGAITQDEVEDCLPKHVISPRIRLPSSLSSKPDLVTPMSHSTPTKSHQVMEGKTLLDLEESGDLETDPPDVFASESSEVLSLTVNVRELTGVVNAFRKDMDIIVSKLESRLASVEARLAQSSTTITANHRRTLSPQSLAPPLPIIVDIAKPITPGVSRASHEELLSRCREHKFTPSKLAQRQIFLSLAEAKEIGDIKLPIPRAQWKPEEIYKIVLSIRLASDGNRHQA